MADAVQAKPAFDPNQPFQASAQVNAPSAKPAFDPSQPFEASSSAQLQSTFQTLHPQNKGVDVPQFMADHPKIAGYTQGTLNALPTAGWMGGGLIGGAAGTATEPGGGTALGAVGGAALGDAAGEAAKNIGEAYLLGKQKSREEIYGNPAKGLVNGAENEAGGLAISKAAGAIKSTPGAIKSLAEAEPEAAQNVVYDPFLKTKRVLGQSTEELQNLGTEITKPGTPQPGLLQKSAQIVDKASDMAGNAWDVTKSVFPYVAKGVGYLGGHIPGYLAVDAAMSPSGRAAAKAVIDASGNMVLNPAGAGLLLNGAKKAVGSN